MDVPDTHYRCLENLYLSSAINRLFPATIAVTDGRADIHLDIGPQHFHAANAAHGSCYFKALDDACFFAVASKVQDAFVLTTSFNLHLTKALGEGRVHAQGRWQHGERRIFLAEAVLYDQTGDEVARATGTFMRSRKSLAALPGYRVSK